MPKENKGQDYTLATMTPAQPVVRPEAPASHPVSVPKGESEARNGATRQDN